MFERYTETARKSVFYARYDAGTAGSAFIEGTHLLAGIMRGDEALATRLLGPPDRIERMRQRVFEIPPQTRGGGTGDLPLSHDARRALSYAAEEAERLHQKHIGPEHLLLGLSHEKNSAAAALLREMGISERKLRQEAKRSLAPSSAPPPPRSARLAAAPAVLRNLSDAAQSKALDPLIGRTVELGDTIQVLLRRHRNWVALLGEPGVGKTALIEGLAQRVEEGAVPAALQSRTVLSMNAYQFAQVDSLGSEPVILCLEGLFDLPEADAVQALAALSPLLHASISNLIATGTPEGFARFPAALARQFERVQVPAASEAETAEIVVGVKERYERFHGVTIPEDVARATVPQSRRFLSGRVLPDRAIDLLDEAGAHARTNGKTVVALQDIEAVVQSRLR